MNNPTMFFILSLLQLQLHAAFARPSILQEQNLGYHNAFLQGSFVGFQSFLALMGYYEPEEVKAGMQSGELVIDEVDDEDQTQVKVVGLGLGRTGTTSLAMALEILGYVVVHDDEETELTDLFSAVEEEEIDTDKYHEILGLRGYNASFKTEYEWVQSNEEVKGILTVRDTPEKYVQSWSVAAPFVQILEKIPYRWMPTVGALYESFVNEYKEETTGGSPDDYLNPEVLRRTYLEYIETVQTAIPSERLLTFNVKQGWAPLCDFLEIHKNNCPTVPFPHVHTRAKLEGEMFFLRMITFIWPLAIILPLYGLMKLGKHVMKRVLDEKSKFE
mmetsp:Transcript_24513/g.48941  ORF Transcript_24513/g.48941 Transcript_24513/m.48941 type:complete len:330 (+) Transcript_24513:307-1296(+)